MIQTPESQINMNDFDKSFCRVAELILVLSDVLIPSEANVQKQGYEFNNTTPNGYLVTINSSFGDNLDVNNSVPEIKDGFLSRLLKKLNFNAKPTPELEG